MSDSRYPIADVSSPAHRASDIGHRSAADSLLTVEQLSTVFDLPGGPAAAVSDVSFHVAAGETLGLVGESGSGKSVTAMSILRLVSPPGRIAAGRIVFNGRDLLTLGEHEMQAVRGAGIGLVFQEPMTALNPVFTIGNQIEETLAVHGIARGRAARDRAVELLDAVSIPDAARRVRDYPHQLSGGLRQRAMIALALCCDPPLVIADEPTTALDVTIQAQILELLRRLQDERRLALLLITHDLGVVAEMADRVAVMYAGRIVEQGPVRDVFHDARHPYTKGLLGSIPGAGHGRLHAIPGSVPALGAMPRGCAFAPRCASRFDPCDGRVPGVTLLRPLSEARGPRPEARSREEPADIGRRTPDSGTDAAHETRCYLYSRAVDPETLPEERS
jgi:oligopeptide/dipeptide ABC transporter ATP-binding protein